MKVYLFLIVERKSIFKSKCNHYCWNSILLTRITVLSRTSFIW